ncbi:MAG: cytochrome c [Pirellulales bacterium]
MQRRETNLPGRRKILTLLAAAALSWSAVCGLASAADKSPSDTPAARGLRLLRTVPYSPADFTAEQFDRAWEVWPPELKRKAESASPGERRRMAFSRYGLIADPANPDGPPLGVVDDGMGGWSMNCLACHQGKVAGRVIWGVGNSHFAFQTLIQDVAKVRRPAGGSMGYLQLGLSNGTTNAQVFSILLTAQRDKDLNLVKTAKFPKFKNHDLDAPPYWNVKRKRNLYIDGFVPKTHRVIMQFALVPTNDAESFKQREAGFRDILAWIESLESPRYPWPVDEKLAEQGKAAFERVCSECHGTYGPRGEYPEKRVPLELVGTDGVRLEGMPPEHRRFYRESWFGEYGKLDVVEEPDGYVAPPLDGVWATAPYFHNGSVPTLWHVLHPDRRPAVWLRTEDGYDRQRAGLEITAFETLPADVKQPEDQRRFFDTRIPGKSAVGHLFPDELNEEEKRATLEYLKTL